MGTITTDARIQTKAGRHYTVDGRQLPSVTTILGAIGKPALINWAAKMERGAATEAAANLYDDIHGTPRMSRPTFLATLESRIGKEKAHKKELEKAGEIGTQVHGLIEWNIRKSLGQKVGPEPKVLDKALWAFMAFEDWSKSVDLKPLAIEQVVFSLRHGYAGTMDLLAEVTHDGSRRNALIDFKTGKAIYDEAYLQNAAYQKALIEMGHQRPDMGLIIRLPKNEQDPEFEPSAPIVNVEHLFGVFLHTKALWQHMNAKDQDPETIICAGTEGAPHAEILYTGKIGCPMCSALETIAQQGMLMEAETAF